MNILAKMAQYVRNLTIREPDGWVPAGQRGDAGEPVTEHSVMALSAVWACVNLISGTISSLPLMVYRTGPNGRTAARDHPLYRLLHDSPNYDQTAVDFWDFAVMAVELWGNGYAAIERTGNRITALTPINPAIMSVRRLESGAIEYRWTEDGRHRVETEQTVLHVRGPGGGPLGGMSTLQFGRHVFSMARAADRAAAGMFANGMRPSVQIAFEKWLTPEQRAIARGQLAELYIGAMNAGRPFIAEGGAKLEAISINPDDAQLLESRGFSVEEVCRFFGVPPHMVGHTSKSTSWGTGLEQQNLGFLQYTLRRRVRRIEQACNKQLLTPADRAQGLTVEFNLEGLLRADSAGRATFYREMTGIGAMTINEVRALENLPPVPGGDVPRMQMQNVPITAAGTEALPAPQGQEQAQ